MSLGNGMMKSRIPDIVGGVDGTAVFQQQRCHGNRADRGGTVNWVLAALVTNS
jgi:hypothetical protein